MSEESYKQYLLKCAESISKTRKVKIDSNGRYMKIQCFNMEHKGGKESTPSFRVNLVQNNGHRAGSGYCFTCGMNYSSWGGIMDALKRPDLVRHETEFESDEDIVLSEDTKKIEHGLLGDDTNFKLTYDSIIWPKHQQWRTINGQLVHDIGGRLYFDEKLETQMLYLPVNVNGNEVGGIRANLVKQGKNNYFNTEGGWVKTLGLFPYDYIAQMLEETGIRTLVLTEGVRDPLKSIQYNIPALAILGVENWTDTKAELILSLPIDRVVLAFDPDEAGERCTKSVYKTLKNEIPTRRFDFSRYGTDEYGNHFDPGGMPSSIAKKLRNLSLGAWS